DTKVSKELSCAGIPVWLFHDECYFTESTIIVKPVALAYLDNIIKGIYHEPGKPVKDLNCMFHRPLGLSWHIERILSPSMVSRGWNKGRGKKKGCNIIDLRGI
ncbi:hypothetical protein PAXRUDRAFT_160570, partial [Paxillus rubicundulus Ve08.2h10]